MLVTLLGLLGVLAVLFVGGVLATRDTGLLRDVPPDRSPVTGAGDLEAVRFSLALRGYRMSQVDEVLDRAAAALAVAQQQLAEARSELTQTRQELDEARLHVERSREPSAWSTSRDEDWRKSGETGTIRP